MKEAFEIARIIQKSLKGQLSESEERQLSDWRKVSGENERAFQFLHGWDGEVGNV